MSSSHVNSDGDPVNRDFSPSPNGEQQPMSADFDTDDAVSTLNPWLHSDTLQSVSLHLTDEDGGSRGMCQDSSIC